jgi:RecA/RadA recombinase
VALFLNQTRSRKPATGGEEEISAGGPPLKLYAGVRLAVDSLADRQMRFRVLKNKAAAAFREGRLPLARGGEVVESP